MTPMDVESPLARISAIFQVIGFEPRLEILLAIGTGEACVCHLEAALGYRQAYISQHLMALRELDLLTTRRDGRFIYYRIEKPEIIEIVLLGARLAGMDEQEIRSRMNTLHAACEPSPRPEHAMPQPAEAGIETPSHS